MNLYLVILLVYDSVIFQKEIYEETFHMEECTLNKNISLDAQPYYGNVSSWTIQSFTFKSHATAAVFSFVIWVFSKVFTSP